MNEIKTCPDCGGALAPHPEPEIAEFECLICFADWSRCGHMLGRSLHQCAKLIPPDVDGCHEHSPHGLARL